MLAAFDLTLAMIQRRDNIRQLLGDGYQEQAAIARSILRGISAERGVTLTDAALYAAAFVDSVPEALALALRAACEGER